MTIVHANGNNNITANFIAQYALAVSAEPNAGTVNSKGGIYDTRTTVNLAAAPVFLYAFTSWSVTDNNAVNPTTVTMNTNKSVSASFVQLKGKTPVQNSGNTYRTATISINLNKYEWVQGTVNEIIKDLR